MSWLPRDFVHPTLVPIGEAVGHLWPIHLDEATLDAFVPAWIQRDWPLDRPRYIGHDITWREWTDLAELPKF